MIPQAYCLEDNDKYDEWSEPSLEYNNVWVNERRNLIQFIEVTIEVMVKVMIEVI